MPNAVPEGDGTQGLQALGIAGQTAIKASSGLVMTVLPSTQVEGGGNGAER